MLSSISKCERCGLCKNQKPLVDKYCDCDLIWVGLSAKEATDEFDKPLDTNTNTGKVIEEIENTFTSVQTYKTNLVKCLPLDKNNKLRYPNTKEMNTCFKNLEKELKELKPKIVFLLGDKVAKSVERNMGIQLSKWNDFNYTSTDYNGIKFVPIQHPSYIYVYKRKYINDYIEGIKEVVESAL